MFGFDRESTQGQVNELAERLQTEAGLTAEQSQKVLETIRNFVVEKYPMLAGAVNNMFGE